MTGVLPQENIEKRRAFKKQPEIVRFFFEYTWYGLESMGRKVRSGRYGAESVARKVWPGKYGGGKYGLEDRNV